MQLFELVALKKRLKKLGRFCFIITLDLCPKYYHSNSHL